MLKLPCDIFIPAAVPDVIDENVARQLNCRYVVEAANGPTTVEGDKVTAQCPTDFVLGHQSCLGLAPCDSSISGQLRPLPESRCMPSMLRVDPPLHREGTAEEWHALMPAEVPPRQQQPLPCCRFCGSVGLGSSQMSMRMVVESSSASSSGCRISRPTGEQPASLPMLCPC